MCTKSCDGEPVHTHGNALAETGIEKGETLSEFYARDLACTGFRVRRNYI